MQEKNTRRACAATDKAAGGAAARRKASFYRGATYTIDDSYGYLLRRVYASIQRHVERRMQPLELTALQWAPLLLISLGKGKTAAELARVMDIDTGAITRMLDRLEAKQLIQRSRCRADRRVVNLELTGEGRAVITQIPDILSEVLNLHLQGFTREELDQLIGFLRRMIANGAPAEDETP